MAALDSSQIVDVLTGEEADNIIAEFITCWGHLYRSLTLSTEARGKHYTSRRTVPTSQGLAVDRILSGKNCIAGRYKGWTGDPSSHRRAARPPLEVLSTPFFLVAVYG